MPSRLRLQPPAAPTRARASPAQSCVRPQRRNRHYARALLLAGLATAIECVANCVAMVARPAALAPPALHRAVGFGSAGAQRHRRISILQGRPGGAAGPALRADVGNASAAAIPLLLPNLAAMIVAFRRGWVVDPAALADGEQAWKTFLADREAPLLAPLPSPSPLPSNHTRE